MSNIQNTSETILFFCLTERGSYSSSNIWILKDLCRQLWNFIEDLWSYCGSRKNTKWKHCKVDIAW